MKTTSPPTTRSPSQLSEPALDAWTGFLLAHSRLMCDLNRELREEHDFGLGDFDVLIHLAQAPRGRLRMCELAEAVLLSPSGLSRRVDRLERAGLVKRERATCDARNVEALLSAAGKQLLRRLDKTHRSGIKNHFADRFSTEELEALRDLLGRLTTTA